MSVEVSAVLLAPLTPQAWCASASTAPSWGALILAAADAVAAHARALA